jgi:hypothetical protein
VKLARYLAIHGLARVQFAAAVGVSRVCVNHWVNERKIPLSRQMLANQMINTAKPIMPAIPPAGIAGPQ